MTIWQQSILFKPLFIGGFAAWVFTIKWWLFNVIPAGALREALYKERFRDGLVGLYIRRDR